MSEPEFDDVSPPEPDLEDATVDDSPPLSRSETEELRDFIELTFTKMLPKALWITWGNTDHALQIRTEAYVLLTERWRKVSQRDHDGRCAWLYRAMQNLEKARNRKELRQTNVAQKDAPLSTPRTRSPEDHILPQIITEQALTRAREVLAKAPKRYEVLVLRVRNGLSTDQIADLLDISEKTVRVHLHKAKLALEQDPEIRKITGYDEEGNR